MDEKDFKNTLDKCRPRLNKMPCAARQNFYKPVKPAGHKVWGLQPLHAGDCSNLAHAQLEEVRLPQGLLAWPCKSVDPALLELLTIHKKL